jgi:general secretion pathway protein J
MISLRKRHSSETGFTLLEVMVAVTLVVVIAVGLWGLFRLSVRTWSNGTRFIDANQRHRSILDSVQKQMASAYPLYSPVDTQSTNARYPIFNGTDSTIQFLSLCSLRSLTNPGLTYVSYEVAQDANGKYSLIERETPYTGQLPDEATMEQVQATPVLENLTECTIEYYSIGDANNAPQWVSEWNAQTLLKVPVAVALTLVSSDSQGNSIDRRIVAPIASDPIDPRVGIPGATRTR